MATNHYENFPVASLLLPSQLRAPVTAIYRFARTADDIADEGTTSPEERLTLLRKYDDALTCIEENRSIPRDLADVFEPLAHEHRSIGLPLGPCHALLSAFMQDVRQSRYTNYLELLNYCACSANPVGQLMLFLFGASTPENIKMSDSICTALQLTNHLQDIAIDALKGTKGRIYLPQDELALWGFSDEDILSGTQMLLNPLGWASFMAFQTSRVTELFDHGQTLPARLGKHSWRIGEELRLTVAGGRKILSKIDSVGGNVYQYRPKLNWRDWILLLLRR